MAGTARYTHIFAQLVLIADTLAHGRVSCCASGRRSGWASSSTLRCGEWQGQRGQGLAHRSVESYGTDAVRTTYEQGGARHVEVFHQALDVWDEGHH